MADSLTTPGFASVPGVPLRQNTFLKVNGISSATSTQIAINLTLLLMNGLVVVQRELFTFPIAYTPTTKTFALSPGTLLNINCENISNEPERGTSHLIAGLQTGDDTDNEMFAILVNNYLQERFPLSWPNPHIQNPLEGRGNWQVVTESDPAAGATKTLKTQAHTRRIIKGIHFTLTTSATAATRLVKIKFNFPHYTGTFPASTTQAASTAINYTAAAIGHNTQVGSANAIIPIPQDISVFNNDSVTIDVDNIQSGDQLSTIRSSYEEFLI